MLGTLLLVLLVLWALGFITGNAFGGLIHLLLVVAVVVSCSGSSRARA